MAPVGDFDRLFHRSFHPFSGGETSEDKKKNEELDDSELDEVAGGRAGLSKSGTPKLDIDAGTMRPAAEDDGGARCGMSFQCDA